MPPPAIPPPIPPPHPKPLWAGLLHPNATDAPPGSSPLENAQKSIGGDPLGLFAESVHERKSDVNVVGPVGISLMVFTVGVALGAAIMHGRSPAPNPAAAAEARPLTTLAPPVTDGGTFATPRLLGLTPERR